MVRWIICGFLQPTVERLRVVRRVRAEVGTSIRVRKAPDPSLTTEATALPNATVMARGRRRARAVDRDRL
jgi:hypothetical protein